MLDFYSAPAFEKAFTYTGNDLGATWSPDATQFRLWAPTAFHAEVCLFRSGNPQDGNCFFKASMEPDVQGTWIAEVPGNLSGCYYTYLVEREGQWVESADPYGKASGINGYRSMVINLEDTDPDGWESDSDPHAGSPITDAVISEVHIRDISAHTSSGIPEKGKYAGLCQENTATKTGKPTGLSHLKRLGITHIQLMPVFDFSSVDENFPDSYNWGYDPAQFFVPEGSYASDAENGAVRIRELKELIHQLHQNGLSVVMDVVFNHVHRLDSFPFHRIVPGYFSRIFSDGFVSNGSCCGNDTASERSMVRKYITDCVLFWVEEYHIDGFRFDLAGLLDTQTLQAVMDTVHQAHPNVLFYGEGWKMDTHPTKSDTILATQENAGLLPQFAFFNDTIRDQLRGSVFDNGPTGFAAGGYFHRPTLEACFMGDPYWATSPAQVINYVSCHDNHTLYDRICIAAPQASAEERAARSRLAGAFVLLSQGVPFFLCGEEMLRSKAIRKGEYDGNSYCAGDSVNAIRWSSLSKRENRETLSYYRGLIAFRKAHPCLRCTTAEEVYRTVHPLPCVGERSVLFSVADSEEELIIGFNGNLDSITIDLPEGDWQINILGKRAGTKCLETVTGALDLPALSAVALSRKRAQKLVEVVAALIWEKDKFLICQRPAHKARGLLWEFVGGKVEKGETFPQALIRECQEELAITLDVGEQFMQVVHRYPDILIRLTLFHCTIAQGIPKLLEHNDMRWIHPSEVDSFDFCPADTDILEEIKRKYGSRPPL